MLKSDILKSDIFIAVILIVLIIAIIIGITLNVANQDKETWNAETDRFVTTDDKFEIGDSTFRVCYDSTTNIVYLYNYHKNGITVLYNENGVPMTYDEYLIQASDK